MIKLNDKRLVEFKYETEEEMKKHEEDMLSEGWRVYKKIGKYSPFWRIYAMQND